MTINTFKTINPAFSDKNAVSVVLASDDGHAMFLRDLLKIY